MKTIRNSLPAFVLGMIATGALLYFKPSPAEAQSPGPGSGARPPAAAETRSEIYKLYETGKKKLPEIEADLNAFGAQGWKVRETAFSTLILAKDAP